MDGVGEKAKARLEVVLAAHREAADRREAEQRETDAYLQLWRAAHDELYIEEFGRSRRDAKPFIALAKAISIRERGNALQLLKSELVELLDKVSDPHDLQCLAADAFLCDALIEASQPRPDRREILRLADEAKKAWPHLGFYYEFRQRLQSRRFADIRKLEAERKAEVEKQSPTTATTTPVAIYKGNGRVLVNGKPYDLTAGNDQLFVETLLKHDGKALWSTLAEAGVSNPSVTCSRIVALYGGSLAPLFSRPNGVKNVGYATTISDGR